jgi:phage-related protein
MRSVEIVRSLLLALLSVIAATAGLEAGDQCSAPVVIPGVRGNATTSKFGDGYITRTSDGQSFTTSKFGDGAITRGRDGQIVTTSRFGSGTISRDSKGATTTTQRFGDGTISRSSSGASATTSRFGSGFTTSQSSWRGGAGVLVVPGSARCR